MNYKDQIDPELRKGAKSFPLNRGIVAMGNVYQEVSWRRTEVPQDVVEESFTTEGFQGLPFKTTVFTPAAAGEQLPALIYVHGGGFVYKAAVYQKKLAMIYARKAGCKVFFPHYHLAPEYKYPAAYEDVLSLYRYVSEHADELGIDKKRIGLAGDSAGASLAALCVNRWEEEEILQPSLQMLVYPLTDAELETESKKLYQDTPQWNTRLNERMWSYYCGEDSELRRNASPMQCPLPSVIPRTYIETAQFDCLHDEGILYGEKLKEAGAEVEINDTEGTYHGYDSELKAGIVQQNIKKRIVFLRHGFRNN